MSKDGEDRVLAMSVMHRAYVAAACVLAWCTLALQLYLTVSLSVTNGMSVTAGVVRFFSYFTVTTNTLAAIMFTSALIARRTQRRSFFARSGVVAAITAYMIVTAVYWLAFVALTSAMVIVDRYVGRVRTW